MANGHAQEEQPTYQITYCVGWMNKDGTSNETEVTVQAATHDEGKQLAVEAMRHVVGTIAYRVISESPQFFPGLPIRVE